MNEKNSQFYLLRIRLRMIRVENPPMFMPFAKYRIQFVIVIAYYRPQTKFAKVMFSQVFVCLQGGLCQGDPPYSNMQAVRIPLECNLV